MSEKKQVASRALSGLDFYDDSHGNEFIKEIERRYSFENDMIRAVSQGNHKAILKMFSANEFSRGIERRAEDSVRNMKNYMIILNTVLRKGAEVGNVHPFYIHGMSSEFAMRIEKSRTEAEIQKLLNEMIYAYCKLVKTHSAKGYSPLVQNVVMLIDADLSGDLTLKTMAVRFNVNASYLSSLFKKDTGMTLTEYVGKKRVGRAKFLLETTSQQIQQISHECGILDVNYFVKIFKKHTGKTPKQYREYAINNAKGRIIAEDEETAD